jgi:hypothetical protein
LKVNPCVLRLCQVRKPLLKKKAVTKKASTAKEETIAQEGIIVQEDVITKLEKLELTDTKSAHEITQTPVNPPTQSKKGMEEMIKVEVRPTSCLYILSDL